MRESLRIVRWEVPELLGALDLVLIVAPRDVDVGEAGAAHQGAQEGHAIELRRQRCAFGHVDRSADAAIDDPVEEIGREPASAQYFDAPSDLGDGVTQLRAGSDGRPASERDAEPTTGSEHAKDLTHRELGPRHVGEREAREHDIEARVGKLQLLGIHSFEANAWIVAKLVAQPTSRGLDHTRRDVDAEDRRGRLRGAGEAEWQQAGARPDIEHAVARADLHQAGEPLGRLARESSTVAVERLGHAVVAGGVELLPSFGVGGGLRHGTLAIRHERSQARSAVLMVIHSRRLTATRYATRSETPARRASAEPRKSAPAPAIAHATMPRTSTAEPIRKWK